MSGYCTEEEVVLSLGPVFSHENGSSAANDKHAKAD